MICECGCMMDHYADFAEKRCPCCGETYDLLEYNEPDDDPLGIEYGMWANTPLGLDDDPDDDWGDYDG